MAPWQQPSQDVTMASHLPVLPTVKPPALPFSTVYELSFASFPSLHHTLHLSNISLSHITHRSDVCCRCLTIFLPAEVARAFFRHERLVDQTQATRLGSKPLYSPSHLNTPFSFYQHLERKTETGRDRLSLRLPGCP